MPSSASKERSKAGKHARARSAREQFILPAEIPIDPESTLDQLTSRFRGVKDGLPELIKNSKDQYSRLGIFDHAERQILAIINTASKRIGVLDFAGAPRTNFEGWTKWSDPTAGRGRAADIEAGHGNGGKAFMVRGATEFSIMESCFEGRRTRKGFRNNLPGDRYKPGFGIASGQPIDNLPEIDPRGRLEQFLGELGIAIASLPPEANRLFEKRCAYTGVLLSKIADWAGKQRPKVSRIARESIPDIIASHGQTALTIETSTVWVLVDGKLENSGQPISPMELEPFPGFETPRVFEMPEILPDPEAGEDVDTTSDISGERRLELRTSARQLQISAETRAKNVIRLWNSRNNVATWPLHSIGPLPATASFIYGELRCPSLVGDHLAGAERLHLSDTPLANALRQWVLEKARDLAEDLHHAMLTDTKPKDRQQAKSALDAIRDLMRRFLEPHVSGSLVDQDEGTATGTQTKGHALQSMAPTYGSRIDRIDLERGRAEICMLAGTSIPLAYSCAEIQEDGTDRPVRSKELNLRTGMPQDWTLDAEGVFRAKNAGITDIWLETPDGAVKSNRVETWVSLASGVQAKMPARPLMQGESIVLPFTFETPDGPLEDALIEATVDDCEKGKIGRAGRFTAGLIPGEVVISVRYRQSECREFKLVVGTDRAPEPEGSGGKGSDIPLILFCGDTAPGKDDLPEDQRTLPGGAEYPTIIEDPQFPRVVWINPTSKEAMRVRQSKGGSTGIGRVVSRTFIHFLALKCFEILKRLYVRQQIGGGSVTEYQYLTFTMQAELECASFIDAAWDLSDQMLSGTDLEQSDAA